MLAGQTYVLTDAVVRPHHEARWVGRVLVTAGQFGIGGAAQLQLAFQQTGCGAGSHLVGGEFRLSTTGITGRSQSQRVG